MNSSTPAVQLVLNGIVDRYPEARIVLAPADIAASFTAELDDYDGLTADEQMAINQGNAWTLFPRLAVVDASRKQSKAAT